MGNRQNAHDWFYTSGCRSKHYETTSYDEEKFYSYGTIIGLLTRDINTNNTICLISYNNFSNTTAKHISYLYNACPYKKVYASFNYGKHLTNAKTLTDNAITYLKSASEKLTLKENRLNFKTLYCMLEDYLNLEFFQDAVIIDKINNTLDLYKDTYNLLIAYENTKKYKQKLKALKAERVKKLENKLKTVLNKYNYLTIINEIFIPQLAHNNSDILTFKDDLKAFYNPDKDLSFISVDLNTQQIKTSQYITVALNVVKPFFKLWKQGKLKHGMQIDKYTIRAVTNKYIQIGCHKITTENIEAIYNLIFNNKEAA